MSLADARDAWEHMVKVFQTYVEKNRHGLSKRGRSSGSSGARTLSLDTLPPKRPYVTPVLDDDELPRAAIEDKDLEQEARDQLQSRFKEYQGAVKDLLQKTFAQQVRPTPLTIKVTHAESSSGRW